MTKKKVKKKEKKWTKCLIGGPGDGTCHKGSFLGAFGSVVTSIGKCAHYRWIFVNEEERIAVGKYTRKNLASNFRWPKD